MKREELGAIVNPELLAERQRGLERQEAMRTIIGHKFAVYSRAWEVDNAIKSIAGTHGEVPLVVLERRESEEAGLHAVLGRVVVAGPPPEALEAGPSQSWEACVSFGIGFSNQLKVDVGKEEVLGKGIDSTVWRGAWEPSRDANSTRCVDSRLTRLAHGSCLILEDYVAAASEELQGLQDSVEMILEAAQDRELNPLPASAAAAAAA